MIPFTDRSHFVLTVEVVPPAGSDPERLLTSLASLASLAIDGFSVATNPIAEGIRLSRELISLARQRFAGACLMPPFDHFEDLAAILTG